MLSSQTGKQKRLSSSQCNLCPAVITMAHTHFFTNDSVYHFAVCKFKGIQLHWGEHPQKGMHDPAVKLSSHFKLILFSVEQIPFMDIQV